MIVNNWEDFADQVIYREADERVIAKIVFSNTRCGCVFNRLPDGVEFAGYAEGSEEDCTLYRLSYPFDMDTF